MENSIFDIDHLPRTYFKMALPVVLGMVVSIIYNVADTFFIARTGDTNIVAGVSLCAPIFTTLMAFGNIYGQGGSSLIARCIGQNDKEHVNRVSSFCFYIALVTGVVLGLLMILFQNQILALIGAKGDALVPAKEYYVVLALGAPLCVLSFIHSNLIRCEGMATESMLGSMTGTILNIILDPILISVLEMGAKGAAIATVCGYVCSDLVFLVIVAKKSRWLSFSISKMRASLDDIRQIFGIGFSAAITNIMTSICTILMNLYLLVYGTSKVASMGIAMKIAMIGQLVLVGFAFGAVPLYGFLMGSNNKEKVKELMKFMLKFFTAISLSLTAIIFVLSPMLLRGMMNNDQVVADGILMLRLQVCGTWFASIVLMMTCLFQASGKVVPSFILSLSRQGILFIIVLMVCKTLFGYVGILSSQLVADVLSAVLALVLYKIYFKYQKL